jgi:hypothetical protein
MAESKEKTDIGKDEQGTRTRSPAYPGINLETAIKRAGELYKQDKMNAIPLAIAVKRWGFKEKSSGGLVTAAALKSFGLMRDSGSGKERKVQLTEEARRILLDTRATSDERDEAIAAAALKPKMHNILWKKWGMDLPPDDSLGHALIFEWLFNENSVPDFIKEYKDTIRFAKLTDSDTLSPTPEDIIKIGDYVQWESQGVVQFEAKRVVRLSDDGTFAFVEGSSTGLPIDQLSKVNAPIGEDGSGGEGTRIPPKTGMKNEVFTLDEGEATLQWPTKMSPESYEDFKAWLDLIARKAKRTVDKKELSEE